MFQINKKKICVFLVWSIMLFSILPVTNVSAEVPPEYTITYDSNDGKGVYLKTTKMMNVDIPVADMDIEHEGFLFAGWALDPTASTPEYMRGDYFKENKDSTLYAIWKKIGEDAEGYTKPKRTITAKNQTHVFGKKFTLKAKVEQAGKLVYESANTSVVTIDSTGRGTTKGCGTVKVTVIAPEDGLFAKSSKTITVTIKPAKPTIKSLTSPSKGRVSCKWSTCKKVTGYQVHIATSGRVLKQMIKKTSFTASATPGTKYTIKVRAYKKSGSTKIYGKWSATKKVRVK